MSKSKKSSGSGPTGKGVKLGLAAVFALGGLSAAVYAGFYYNKPEVDAEAMVLIKCKKCNAEFELPFAEYIDLAPGGTDLSGGITCAKCGAEASAQRVNRVSDRVYTPPDYDQWGREALTVDDLRREKGLDEEEEEYIPAKEKPAKFIAN